MHHDVAAQIGGLLAGLSPGPPLLHRTGLVQVPLQGRDLSPGVPVLGLSMPGVELAETTPPAAGDLLATNHGQHAVAVHSGDLFAGGLARRAAREAAMLQPNEERILGVEAVQARWWPAGPPVRAGTLPPPESALVALAGLAAGTGSGIAAIARTCLWTLDGEAGLEADACPVTGAAIASRGWAVLAGGRVLAVRVWGRSREVRMGGVGTDPTDGSAERAVQRFLSALRFAAWVEREAGVVETLVNGHRARAVHVRGAIVELSTALLTNDLAAALVRRPAAT